MAKFCVKDTDLGISSQDVGTLFDEYSQVETAQSNAYAGTGLGLSISRKFCRMLGGDITVTSEENVGSTFTIELPVNYEARQEEKL